MKYWSLLPALLAFGGHVEPVAVVTPGTVPSGTAVTWTVLSTPDAPDFDLGGGVFAPSPNVVVCFAVTSDSATDGTSLLATIGSESRLATQVFDGVGLGSLGRILLDGEAPLPPQTVGFSGDAPLFTWEVVVQ